MRSIRLAGKAGAWGSLGLEEGLGLTECLPQVSAGAGSSVEDRAESGGLSPQKEEPGGRPEALCVGLSLETGQLSDCHRATCSESFHTDTSRCSEGLIPVYI